MRDRIVLATCRAWPELSSSDRALADALERRGFLAESATWNGPFAPFAGATAVVIRATWDYHRALDDYGAWLDRLRATRAYNAPGLVRWNLDKSYLTELAARGAPAPASAIVEADAAHVADALARMAAVHAELAVGRNAAQAVREGAVEEDACDLARCDLRDEFLDEHAGRAGDGADACDRVGFAGARHVLDTHAAGPDRRLDHPLGQCWMAPRSRP